MALHYIVFYLIVLCRVVSCRVVSFRAVFHRIAALYCVVQRAQNKMRLSFSLAETATEKDIRDFCNELNIMSLAGDHPNVVSLVGACTTGGEMIVATGTYTQNSELVTGL